MKILESKYLKIVLSVLLGLMLFQVEFHSQTLSELTTLSISKKQFNSEDNIPMQKPTKKIYFTAGGKIGMFFLQGDYAGNQMISLEPYGKYVGDNFFAEIAVPIRFKTSPAFTDIGLDINVLYPFLGPANKTEFDPFVGGGLGLHFIGKDDSGKRVALASYDFREHKANLSRESIAWHAKLRQANIIIDRQAKTIDFQNKQLINLAGKDEWQRMMLEQAKQDASIKRMYNPQPSPFGGYGMLGGYGGMGGAQMGGGDEDSGSE